MNAIEKHDIEGLESIRGYILDSVEVIDRHLQAAKLRDSERLLLEKEIKDVRTYLRMIDQRLQEIKKRDGARE